MDWKELIGKKIVALRGIKQKISKYSKKTEVPLSYILFDKPVYLELNAQDEYEYHDCSSSARHVDLYSDEKMWEQLMYDDFYIEPTNTECPF